MATKVELEQQVLDLQEQLATGYYGTVDFVKCPDNSVGLFADQGSPICLFDSDAWCTIVACMSAGGNNQENHGHAIRLHVGS